MLAASTVVALAFAVTGAATMEGHQVSVLDPYAACIGVGADPFGGVNYPDSELEPWVARNPADPNNMIGAFQQDRWSDGGARGLVAGWSFNDGLKWGVTALPFSKCALPYYGGTPCPTTAGIGSPVPCSMAYDRASDPWVDVGPDGRAYAVSISFNATDNNNGVGASVSTDGGVHWGLTTEVIHDLDADPRFPFNDKESVTADPTLPGTAYVVWDRLSLRPCGPNMKPARPLESGPKEIKSADPQGEPLDCFEGPTYFSRTTDGGLHWDTPRPIAITTPNEQTISNQIVVDPRTGRLYDFYVHFNFNEPFAITLEMVFSNDKGLTWSAPQLIDNDMPVGVHDPQSPDTFARSGDIIPEPAIDAQTGQLYLVWQDSRYNDLGEDDVVISTSVQGGLTGTWTVPQRVNLPEDRAGFTPGIKVNALSQVGVDYYSLRHPDLGPDVWPIDRYLRISDGPAVVSSPQPGQRPVATFSFNTPTHVTGPFNLLMAPFAGGYFTGDYESMVIDRDGRSFHTYYAQMNCDTTNCPAVGTPTGAPVPKASSPPDPMDIYTNKYFKNG